MATLELPAGLRPAAKGRAKVDVDGQTVGEVLEAACRKHPALREGLFTEAGTLKRTVALFVDDEDLRSLGGLSAPVSQRSVLVLVLAVAGG